MNHFKILVNGQLLDSNKKIEIYNPSTNTVAGTLPLIEPEKLVNDAFLAAHNAYHDWKFSSYETRKNLLLQFTKLLLERADEIASIMVSEIAKNFNDAKNEVLRTVDYIYETIKVYEQEMLHPEVIDETQHHIKGKVGKFYHEPLGVILAVAPFNYPVNLLLSKLAPALLIGNTVVYKVATQGSLSGAYISQLFYESNFPAGVINCVVANRRELGNLLFTNKYIDMIAFTGGTKTGKEIEKLNPGKPLLLELGGKDPALILEDADLELATKEIVKGSLSYNGQRCTAIKRVFVCEKLHDQFIQKLNEAISQLSVGDPNNNCFITPLISKKSVDYALELVEDAKNHGAKIMQPINVQNNLLHPIVVDNVTKDMRLAWEETFGPVLPIIKYNNLDDAINLINASEYGLQASIFSKDEHKAADIARYIEAGSININRSSSRGPDIFPFSGVKNSGFGTQGIKNALYAMSQIKGIVFNE